MILVILFIFVFCILIALAESYYERDWPRDTGKFAVFSGILLLCCFWIFGQNSRWDMPSEAVTTLLFVAGFAFLAARLYRLSKLASFRPYEVVIGVNFATLCEDLALEWIAEKPRDGRTFTAITPFLFDLTDCSNERKYMIGLYFNVDVSCVKIPWQPGPGSRLGDGPRFSFRPRYVGYDGYQFEVQVDPEWWSHHKSRVSPDICNLPVESDGTIVLGFLPAGYIPDHLRREFDRSSSLFGLFERRQRKWKAKLLKLGWSIQEYDPGRLQHRYLNIKYFLY